MPADKAKKGTRRQSNTGKGATLFSLQPCGLQGDLERVGTINLEWFHLFLFVAMSLNANRCG
jgi:hypothetical protein